jgi:hypothetical protein
MEAVWGAVLSFLFVLATLSGYGTGLPQVEKPKDKSEQSDKKDEKKKDEDKKGEKSDETSSKDKSEKKGKAGQKGPSGKASEKKAEFCIKDCPEAWRIRP